MHDDEHKHAAPDPKDLDIQVKVGWVKGLNRLYFLYEAYDNYWDFADPGLHNDTFEIVVDGDRSGGPLIPQFRNNADQDEWDAHFSMHGVQAQNYHIMTPSEGKDWALAWGCQPWDKELPWANHAQNYNFKPGESGKYVLEFYITPFDYAGCEGPQRAVESELYENKLIGLSWAVIDYDGADAKNNGFWNLGAEHTMYGNATLLREFRLMPLEPQFRKPIEAQLELQGARHEAPPGRVPGRVRGQDHQLEMGLRRRHQLDRAAPRSTQYKDAGEYVVVLVHRRARRQVAPVEDLGRDASGKSSKIATSWSDLCKRMGRSRDVIPAAGTVAQPHSRKSGQTVVDFRYACELAALCPRNKRVEMTIEDPNADPPTPTAETS